jgi:hypothetical protein
MREDPTLQLLVPFLIEHGALDAAHGTRCLLDHLLGTFRFLREWGNPTPICIAGLFHTYYGSESYKKGLEVATIQQRRLLRRVIGVEAEELVWLYSCAEHSILFGPEAPGSMEGKSEGGGWVQRRSALLEICLANFLEQLHEALTLLPYGSLYPTFDQFRSVSRFLSPAAREALEMWFKRSTIGPRRVIQVEC